MKTDKYTKQLTRRETEVISLIDRGLSNKEIARELKLAATSMQLTRPLACKSSCQEKAPSAAAS